MFKASWQFVEKLERQFPTAQRELARMQAWLAARQPERRPAVAGMEDFVSRWLWRARGDADPFAGWPEWRKNRVRQAARYLASLPPDLQKVADDLAGGSWRALPCPV